MTSQTSFTSCMHDQMLESNRDDVKLEAMRCVTVMTAKGKLSVPRTLFPHIVKNVSSKNPELKKLIYLYLTNFADQEPDLALLPVATLQKSLKSPNPLVRSSALKVLTSMRLSILSAILMATLRNSVNDLSPYVRKTVAHSIIKIYRLEPGLQSDLIEYVERLFNDKNSMVLSSAVASFEVVCPDKLDLVHKHYRRFCFVLADCNEWGQTLLLNLLVRYVLNTYKQNKNGTLTDYNPSEHDPKILLRSAKPLVHSNNSAVVMAVIKLYIAIANHNEVRSTITRPLIRLLYSQREIQLTVLNMIEELTTLKADSPRYHDAESDDNDNDNEHGNAVLIAQENGNLDKDNSKLALSGDSDTSVDIQVENIDVQTLTRDGYIPLDDEDGVVKVESPIAHDEEAGSTKLGIDAKQEVDITGKEEESNKDLVEAEDGKEDGDDDDDESSGDDDDESSDDDDESSDDDETEEDDSEGEEDEEDEDGEDAKVNEGINSESDKENDDKKEFDLNSADFEANKDPNAYQEVFRPYIKSFFVKYTDSTQVRLAKLRILTNLSSSVNVSLVLKELQAYIATYVEDREFVSAAIHAMGRCAIIVKEVAHTCLNGLTNLLSNNNEHIVSEAIVVLRSQIINKRPINNLASNSWGALSSNNNNNNNNNNTELSNEKVGRKLSTGSSRGGASDTRDHTDQEVSDDNKIVSTVIKQVTKLLPTVTAPQARATILWILAEFCDKNLTAAKCAPNVLRSIAKSFCQEDNFVKLQSLTLASKFLLSLDKEKKADLYHRVHLLTSYLFSLAKYDTNHDVRDRGRFLKKLLDDEEICSKVLNGIGHLQTAAQFTTQTVQ